MTKTRSCSVPRPRQLAAILIVLAFGMPNTDSLIGQDKPSETQPAPTSDEPATLPKYQDLTLPEAEDLLRSRPFDWIVLKNQDVVIAEPISIRPDLMTRITVNYEIAQRNYNRTLKHKPYRDTEILSLRQYLKAVDRAGEIVDQDAELKSELDLARDRLELFKPATFKIRITLKDLTVESEFLLEVRHVDFILYYEDLLLRRADLLIAAGNTSLAYDLLLFVARRHRENNEVIRKDLKAEEAELVATIKKLDEERNSLRRSRDELIAAPKKNLTAAKARMATIDKTIPNILAEIKDVEDDLRSLRLKLRFDAQRNSPNPDPPSKDDLLLPAWPKFDEVYQRLLVKDSDQHLQKGDLQGAWRLLTEAWKPGIEVGGLSSRMGTVIDQLISQCMEQSDFRQARFHLRELLIRDPSNAVAIGWRGKLADLASSRLAEARVASDRGDSADAAGMIEMAARIWPELAGLKEAHRELNDRYQILRVGVLHLSGEPSADHLPTEADERVRLLAEARMFEPIAFADQAVRYGSSFLESWEPTDLGRQVRFQLKLRRSDSESRPLITSADIHREIASRLHPDSPEFDERLAGFVEGLSVQSPTEFTVRFRQLPLRLESLWQMTVAAGEPSKLLNEDASDTSQLAFGRERFHRGTVEQGRLRLTRTRQQSATSRQHRVDEVVEIRYPTWERGLQALLRGDVAVLPKVDLVDLKGLQDDGRFQVIPYVQPRTHLLMFNPQSAALNDGQLRRALLHGIPREEFLNTIILKEARGSYARLVTCPFPTSSYAYHRQLAQPSYDPSLSAALALTARKRLGGQIPTLKMICPDDPHIREVARSMIEQWKRIGIEVLLVDDPASEWEICYRTVKSTEPLMDAWPLLTMSAEARISALQGLPESTRRLLLELERSVDWTAATKLLHRLEAELLTDARYIPLWEVDEFLVARRHIVGLPPKLLHAYQDTDRWSVQSWYPQDGQ